MLVFISWSGQRSKVVAEALENWLAQVVQAVEPWISQDIDKGLRWGTEIADRLERSKVGIICLTKSNLDSKWIHFEVGALSKTKDAYVCTLLLDIKPSDVEQPLAQFQHTTIDKEDIFQLLSTINREVHKAGEKALSEQILRGVFETNWPRLDEAFKKAALSADNDQIEHRSDRDILEELLQTTRSLSQNIIPRTIVISTSEIFKQIMEELERRRRMFVATALNGATRIDIEGNELIIEFAPETKHLGDTLAKPETIKLLRNVCQSVLGRDVDIRINTISPEDKKERQRLWELAEQDPVVQDFLKTFRAEIVDVKEIKAD